MSEEFNPDELREDLATLAELWRGLENLETEKECVLFLKSGQQISGRKAFFSNGVFGIYAVTEFQVPDKSDIIEMKPGTPPDMFPQQKMKTISQIIYWRFRTDAILGYGTFPKVAK